MYFQYDPCQASRKAMRRPGDFPTLATQSAAGFCKIIFSPGAEKRFSAVADLSQGPLGMTLGMFPEGAGRPSSEPGRK